MSQTESSGTANPTAAEAAAKLAAIGEAALEEGDFAEAISCFRQALKVVPGNIAIMRQLGESLAANGDLAGAEVVLSDAARQASGDAAVLVDLAHVRQMRGDREGARAAIEQAVAASDDTSLRLDQARLYESLGEARLAAATFAAVAQSAPTAGVLNDLARLYLQIGQYNDADATFRRLGALDSEHELVALHGRIWSQIKRRDWRSALELALHAARVDRFNLTTILLTYARDRLFTRLSADEIATREGQLEERFLAELHEHAEIYGSEEVIMPAGTGEDW